MAKSWRGYRPIVLHGRRFRWMCQFNHPLEVLSAAYANRHTEWSPDILKIRPEDNPDRLLTVSWPACHGPVVKPDLVRACIEEALRRGWLVDHPVTELVGSDLTAQATR
jgi:hypothetical protein